MKGIVVVGRVVIVAEEVLEGLSELLDIETAAEDWIAPVRIDERKPISVDGAAADDWMVALTMYEGESDCTLLMDADRVLE